MKKPVLAFLAAVVAWTLIVSLLNRGLRVVLAGYAAAEPQLTFTLPMMAGRLTIAAITSLVTGAIIGTIAPAGRRTPWIFALLLLAIFVPEHVHLWDRFPVWYHLTFLLTIVPLIVFGARLGRGLTVARRAVKAEDAVTTP